MLQYIYCVASAGTARALMPSSTLQVEEGDFAINDCEQDYFFVNGDLFCGNLASTRVIGIDVRGKSVVGCGLSTNESGRFKGFLLKWELS